MTTITIEQLAEKLNGNLWIKGDMKRIYLDEGYNTKKMSTKTYIYQKSDGTFGVSCGIDCPSQHDNWISSQEDEIIASVERRIENIFAQSTLELVDYKILDGFDGCEVLVKKDSESEPNWFNESEFNSEFGDYPADVFGGKLEEELEEAYKIARQKRDEENAKKDAERIELENKKKAENIERAKEELTNIVEAQRVNHSKFGKGTVISSSESKIEVLFDDAEIGLKSFLPKFVKFEIINE